MSELSVDPIKYPVILGLSWNHDSHAAIFTDGQILASVGEERISRVKNHYGFPYKAIDECLELSGLSPQNIDVVAVANTTAFPAYLSDLWFNQDKQYDTSNYSFTYVKYLILKHQLLRFGRDVDEYNAGYRDKHLGEILSSKGIDAEILFYDHHACHAASAFYSSEFDESFIAIADQHGDGKCCSFWHGRGTEISLVKSYNEVMSPGAFYTEITKYLGFKRYRHEGKVTGLSARGDAQKLREPLSYLLKYSPSSERFSNVRPKTAIKLIDKVIYGLRKLISREPYQSTYLAYQNYFREKIDGHMIEDVAAGAQAVLEDFILDIVQDNLEDSGCSNVAVAGGIFANVLINQKVLDLPQTENLFVFPNMGDGGLAVGAAQIAFYEKSPGFRRQGQNTFFLGGRPNTDGLRDRLENSGYQYTEFSHLNDQADAVANLLQDKLVVGIVREEMEFGPRALCHRSIIASPCDASINVSLNARLNRTEFMPFAPVITGENQSRIFPALKCSIPAKYMTVTARVSQNIKDLIPAVVHIDDTARPQIVSKESDPFMYKVLTKFEQLTSIPALINTSFNVHEEPIVYTTNDALRAFESGKVDALVINNFVIQPQLT